MSSKLSMQDIVDLLVANNEISKEDAELFVAEFFSLIEKGLSTDELVKVKDFGSFKLTQIQERESVNVNTQEKIVIPAHRRVSFVPAPSLKELVNKPFAHFETTPLNEGIFMDGISEEENPSNENEELDNEVDEDDITDKEDVINEESNIEIESAKPDIQGTSIENEPEEIQNNESLPIADTSLSPNEIEVEESAPIENDPISAAPQEDAPSLNEVKEEQAVEEQIIDEETKEESKLSTQKPIVVTSNKSTTKKPKTKGKLRCYILRWDIGIALFMILSISFAYNFYFSKHNPCKKGIEESEIPKPVKQINPAPAETPSSEPIVIVDSVETEKIPVEPPKMVKMSPGRTLRLIAQEKLGSREFWVYIYMKNKDKIENPDVIPIGLELELPTTEEYPMDANNPDQVAKAKIIGDGVMKEFG